MSHKGYILPLTVDCQVTGKTECVENGETVTVYLVASGAGDLTEHRETEVHELHRHDGFLCLLAGNYEVLDVIGSLFPGLPGQVNLTQNREIDIPVSIEGVAGNVSGRQRIVRARSGCQGLCLTYPVGLVRHIEHCRNFRDTGIHDD